MPEPNAELERLKAVRADIARWDGDRKWAATIRDNDLSRADVRSRFLVQGIEEDKAEFDKRAELTTYAPLTPLIAERIKGAVFKRPPTIKAPDALDAFTDSATPDGRNLKEFAVSAVMDALWYRFSVVLIDRQRIDPAAAPVTAADDEAMGLDKPYCVSYHAGQILDYHIGADGTLQYIRLDGPTYPRGNETVREIREIDPSGIKLHRIVKDAGGLERLEPAIAPIPFSPGMAGRLPVIPVGYDTIDGIRARSPLCGALEAEKEAFRELSSIIWGLWLGGHPVLLAKVRQELAKIGVGINKFIHLVPTSTPGEEPESIAWLEATLPGLAHQVLRYAAARDEIQQQAGIKPIAEIARVQPESGAALTIKADAEAYVLGNISDMAADVLWEILCVAGMDLGAVTEDTTDEIEVSYSKDFSLQGPERAMAMAQTFKGLLGPEHPATKEALRRAVLAALDNLTLEQQTEIEAAINSQGAYVPAEPDLMGGAAPKAGTNVPKKSTPNLTGGVAGGPAKAGKPKE
jgi:hypothetical protein